MKSGCALKKLKVAIYIVRLISYSLEKMLLNHVLISAKVICGIITFNSTTVFTFHRLKISSRI